MGPIVTQENVIGNATWFTEIAASGQQDVGIVYWRGVDSITSDCGDIRTTLTPRIVGVAASIYDNAGAIVDNTDTVMRLYLVDTREMDSLFKGRDFAAYLAISRNVKKKFIGGFYRGDISKREIYATNFGAGFAASHPAVGGSSTSYGVMCLWKQNTAAGVNGMMLVDWGMEKSTGAAT
ncbi:MAG: hypothetical protein V3V08_23140 [Nannocystaceae bacterium]